MEAPQEKGEISCVPKDVTSEPTIPKPIAKKLETTDFELELDHVVPLQSVYDFPRWLNINLRISNVTVGLMAMVALANLAFADVMRSDLKNDVYDSVCESNYIRDASETASTASAYGPGRYHNDCKRLYLSSYVLLVAGTFSILRAIPVCFFPAQIPSRLSIRYRPNGFLDRLTSPARIYGMRTFFSIVSGGLYLFGIAAIGTSRLMTGPPAADSYKTMYTVSLVLLAFSTVASMHQAITTAYAGLVWKLWRET